MGKGKGFGKKSDPVAKEAQILGDEVVAKLDSASPEELKRMGYECANKRLAAIELRKADPVLAEAKEKVAISSAPHREAMKRLDVEAKWIKVRMEAKGMDTGAEVPEVKPLDQDKLDKMGGPKPASPFATVERAKAAVSALGATLKPGETLTLVSGGKSATLAAGLKPDAETQVSHGFGGNLKPLPS